MSKVKVLDQAQGNGWVAWHGDCCEVTKGIPDNSIHYSVFSPPFNSLYTYSASDRDMGNCKLDAQFYRHFRFLVKELYRILKPGRCLTFHVMQIPAKKGRDGFIGIKNDLRGDLIRIFKWAGFIHFGEIVVRKDPVVAQQRTNAITLLHKQVCKDSAMSSPNLNEYLITMKKPGENLEPVAGAFDEYYGSLPRPNSDFTTYDDSRNGYSIDVWQRYAEGIWTDINPNDTLNGERGKKRARHEDDAVHICPLQLTVIRRLLQLYTNKGDVVFSPFGGIGSESYVALEMGRKAATVELKESYFKELTENLKQVAGDEVKQMSLTDLLEVAA